MVTLFVNVAVAGAIILTFSQCIQLILLLLKPDGTTNGCNKPLHKTVFMWIYCYSLIICDVHVNFLSPCIVNYECFVQHFYNRFSFRAFWRLLLWLWFLNGLFIIYTLCNIRCNTSRDILQAQRFHIFSMKLK